MSRRHRNLDLDANDTPTRHANGHTDRSDTPGGATARSEGYSDLHRAFLQAFLARSVMGGEEVRGVLARVMSVADPTRPTLPNDITAPLLTQTLQTLNARLAPLDYEIRSTRDQQSALPSSSLSAPANDHVYALVNTASDPLTQLATGFSAEEIAFVKRVLDAMFDGTGRRGKEVMAVDFMEARRLAPVRSAGRPSQAHLQGNTQADGDADGDAEPALKGIDIRAAESVLGTLVEQGFFRRQKVGGAVWFGLAPRGLMELRSYLKEVYNDPAPEEEGEDEDEDERVIRIRDCEGCREIVTWGVRCSRRTCGVRFHDGCAWQYFGRRGGGDGVGGMVSVGKCPACRAEWTGDCYVGPRAVVGGGGRASAAGAGRVSGGGVSNGRVSSGGGGRRGFVDMGDEEDDEDEGY